FSSAPPASGTDPQAVSLGVKFRSDIAGDIKGILFYKASQNTGAHTASLWTSTGTLLAQARAGTETPSGWQQVSFASPVTISANTLYVASVHTTSGNYSFTRPYFTSTFDNGPLHAPADTSVG